MKRILSASIIGLALIALGLFLLINPTSIIKILVIVFGVYTALEGVSSLFSVFKLQKNSRTYITGLIKSLLNIAIGVLVVYLSVTSEGAEVATWVVYLIAIDLLLSAAVNCIELYMLSKANLSSESLASSVILSIIFAIILFVFPALITSVAITIIGIILIVVGVGVGVWVVRLIKLKKALKEQNTVVDGEFTEVKEEETSPKEEN